MRRDGFDYLSIILLIVGSLIFAISGLAKIDLVSKISEILGFGAIIIYIIVGIAAILSFRLFRRY